VQKTKVFFGIIFLFILFKSCSTSKDKFLNRQYHKINTKYNVLFNGNESFEIGKKILDEVYIDDFYEVLPVEPIILRGENFDNSTLIPGFERAEEKAVKAIQKHSMNIKGIQLNPLIDNSYLLLGKARYYDRRFFPALESFNYLLENYSNSNSYVKARVWKEKTNIRLNNNELAIKNLKSLSQNLIKTNDLYGLVNSALAQAHINIKQIDSAKFYIKKAALYEKKINKKARYYFITGQLFEKLNQSDSAIWAFEQIKNLKGNFHKKFLVNAIIKKAFLENNTDFLFTIKMLEKLLKNFQNEKYKHFIYSGLGNLSLRNKKDSLASKYFNLSQKSPYIDIYTKIHNYEELLKYNFNKGNYLKSGKYIDSLISLYDSSDLERKLLNRKKESLSGVLQYENIVSETDSLIEILVMDKNKRYIFFKSYIEQKQKKEQDSLLRSQKKSKFSFSIKNENENFYFYNPNLVLIGKQQFKSSWGNRPNIDNWRSANSTSSIQIISNKNIKENIDHLIVESPEFYLNKIPKEKNQIDSIFSLNEKAYLKLGTIYKERFKNNELASKRLIKLLNKKPSSNIEVQALYHLYKIYEKENDSLSNFYKVRLVKNYPETAFAKILADPANYNNKGFQSPQSIYLNAYQLFEKSKYVELLVKIEQIRIVISGSEIEPKLALLKANTMGRIYGVSIWKKELKSVYYNYPKSKEGEYSKQLLENITGIIDVYKQGVVYKNYKWIFPFNINEREEMNIFYKHIKQNLSLSKPKWSVSQDFYNDEYIFIVIHGIVDVKETEDFILKIDDETKLIKKWNNFVALSAEYRNIIKNKSWKYNY
jgi:hypothetical protein